MKSILSIVSGNIESGGMETYLKNAYENMNRSDLEIDILVPGKIIFKPYAEAFRSMGCNLLVMDIPQDNGFRYIKLYQTVDRILKNKEYDIVHVNTGNLSIQTVALRAASNNNVPERIAHSHGTLYKGGRVKELLKSIMRTSVNHNATKKMACSRLAAESLFGVQGAKEAIIARNGIRVNNYKFDETLRTSVRKENGWDGKYVIGSVGRLAPEKNYEYILQMFCKFLNNHKNSLLVLVGDGEERKPLEEKSQRLGIYENVQFMGIRNDVAVLMQGMDVFTLASKREALGIVNIEAQAAGLPCVVSDALPREVDLTGDVRFLPLDGSFEDWIRSLSEFIHFERKDNTNTIKAAGYDFKDAYSVINRVYHGQV